MIETLHTIWNRRLAAGLGWLPRLVRCCRVLGIRAGWRYWRLDNAARRDPMLVPAMCNGLEAEARKLRTEGNEIEASLLEDYAIAAREHNRRFHSANAKIQPPPCGQPTANHE